MNLIICLSWSEIFSPLERPAPLPASFRLAGKRCLGSIRAVDIQIDLGGRGLPYRISPLSIKLER